MFVILLWSARTRDVQLIKPNVLTGPGDLLLYNKHDETKITDTLQYIFLSHHHNLSAFLSLRSELLDSWELTKAVTS